MWNIIHRHYTNLYSKILTIVQYKDEVMTTKDKDKEINAELPAQSEEQAMEANTPQTPAAMRKLREKIKARYPDQDPQSEEDWFALEDKYAEDVEEVLAKYKESEMTLHEVMMAYPELAMILNDIVANKLSVKVALAKHYSQEDLIPQEGDDDYEASMTAYNEKLEKAKKRSEIDKEIEANQDASIVAIDAYCESKGYSEEQKTKLIDFINDTFQDLLMKKVTEPILQAFDKAMNYDTDIAQAAQAGEINGKNANINTKIEKEKIIDDGVPAPGKGGPIKEVEMGKNARIFADIGKRKGI